MSTNFIATCTRSVTPIVVASPIKEVRHPAYKYPVDRRLDIQISGPGGSKICRAYTCSDIYEYVRNAMHESITAKNKWYNRFGRQRKKVAFCLKYRMSHLVDRDIPLKEYGIRNRDTVVLELFFLQGGSDDEDYTSSEDFSSDEEEDVEFDIDEYLAQVEDLPPLEDEVIVHTVVHNTPLTFLVSTSEQLYIEIDRYIPHGTYFLSRHTQFLSHLPVLLRNYGFRDHVEVTVHFVALEGGAQVEPEKKQSRSIIVPLLEQGALMGASVLLEKHCDIDSADAILHSLECITIGYHDLKHVYCKADFLFWCQKFVKMLSRRNFSKLSMDLLSGDSNAEVVRVVHRYFTDLDRGVDMIFAPQSDFAEKAEGFEENLAFMRSMISTAQTVEDHPIVKRFVALTSYLVVFDIMKKFNISYSLEDYNDCERQAMKAKFSSKKGFALCVADVSLFIVERVYQVYKTGQWSSILHSGSAYEKWLDVGTELKRKSMLLSNPAAHGFTIYEFLQELKDAIEQGTTIKKFPATDSRYEMKMIKSMLNDLQMIDANEITRRAARAPRDAPFACLIVGKSGIGKSGIMEILFRHYAQYFGLPGDSTYCYTRNHIDEFWSGFTSACWAAVFDDIAAVNPDQIMEDKTVSEILQVVNNVPFVTNQAELNDKGRIPFRCELVLASTNQADLNAHRFYQNPAAAQRRFPFVVKVEVKEEFMKDGFIDKKKAVPPQEGYLPNYWVFHIMRYETYMNDQRQMSQLKPVLGEDGKELVYDDVNEFMVQFIRTVESHKRAQIQAKTAYGSAVEICRTCAKVKPLCKCAVIVPQVAVENAEPEVVEVPWQDDRENLAWYRLLWRYTIGCLISLFMTFLVRSFGYLFKRFNIVQRIISFFLQLRILRYCVWYLIETYLLPKEAAFLIGLTIEKRRQLKYFSFFIIGMTAIIGSYSVYNMMKGDKEEEEIVQEQGATESIGKPIEVAEPEKENVWHTTTYECTTQDVAIASQSLVGKSDSQVRDMLSANVVFVSIQFDDKQFYSQKAICLKSQKYVMNAHALKDVHDDGSPVHCYNLKVNIGLNQPGVSQIIHVKLVKSDFYIDLARDLCMFELAGAPPKKDITKFMAPRSFTGVCDGFLLVKDVNGRSTIKSVTKIMKTWSPPNCLDTNCSMYTYQGNTVNGDCGSMLVVMAPRGAIVAGYHAFGVMNGDGTPRDVGMSINLDSETVEEMLIKFEPQCLSVGDIEPGEIALDLVEGDRKIMPLHHKSTFAFMENGSANVYGTLSGFRAKPRSKVRSTPLREVVEAEFGKKSDYGPPKMEGYNIWRKNLLPLVNRKRTYNRQSLKKARDGFLKDILTQLDEQQPGWESEVQVLDNFSTVNGINGVKFIDAMNFNSSMGNPWNTSKKKFLHAAPCEAKPDGRDFEESVWDRVEKCYESYKNGVRYHPVFNQIPKDEATPKRKYDAEKTRLFSSGPVDAGIVGRKFLLSFVRLVQKNKFIFESGPGTVCQSAQWEEIYDYLNEFGENTHVFGDHARFDKDMLADFMLSAFWIIKEICKRCNYSEEDLKVVNGIAFDTCFPVTNFNGDLVEFYGSNPSGHFLTVIINGLVNALYCRYAYVELSPMKECSTFKQNVRLMTYGDDNGMGVNPSIPWFNHTSMQAVLKDIGLEYTMSDKETASIPFVDISEEQFLKRSWRYDETVDAMLCPLVEDSIFKSLTVWVPSGSVSVGHQMMSVVQSAIYEYFYYGKKKFNERRDFLMSACKADPYIAQYITESSFPTYEMLHDNWWKASEGCKTKRHGVITKELINKKLMNTSVSDAKPHSVVSYGVKAVEKHNM